MWKEHNVFISGKKCFGKSFSFQIVPLIKLLKKYKMNCTKTLKKGQHATRNATILLKSEGPSLKFYLWLSLISGDKYKTQVAKHS